MRRVDQRHSAFSPLLVKNRQLLKTKRFVTWSTKTTNMQAQPTFHIDWLMCLWPSSILLRGQTSPCPCPCPCPACISVSICFQAGSAFTAPVSEFLQYRSTVNTHTHTHFTGPTGCSKFPFTLLIIGACWYFMRPCKPLNYCTFKYVPTP